MSVSLYLTVGLIALAMHSAPRVLLAMLVGALAATEVHGCVRGLVLSNADWRAKMYARTCVSISSHTINGCSDYSPYPGWDFLRENAPIMERLGLFQPGLFKGSLPPEGSPTGDLAIDRESIKGKTNDLREPIHAIFLGYRKQGKVEWLGTALPSLPSQGFIHWDSRLQIPAEATEILAFRYNADSGQAAFLAKAAVPTR